MKNTNKKDNLWTGWRRLVVKHGEAGLRIIVSSQGCTSGQQWDNKVHHCVRGKVGAPVVSGSKDGPGEFLSFQVWKLNYEESKKNSDPMKRAALTIVELLTLSHFDGLQLGRLIGLVNSVCVRVCVSPFVLQTASALSWMGTNRCSELVIVLRQSL